MIEMYFPWYVDNTKLFLSQFDPAENIKNENKNRTRASLFKSSEEGNKNLFSCGLYKTLHWIVILYDVVYCLPNIE